MCGHGCSWRGLGQDWTSPCYPNGSVPIAPSAVRRRRSRRDRSSRVLALKTLTQRRVDRLDGWLARHLDIRQADLQGCGIGPVHRNEIRASTATPRRMSDDLSDLGPDVPSTGASHDVVGDDQQSSADRRRGGRFRLDGAGTHPGLLSGAAPFPAIVVVAAPGRRRRRGPGPRRGGRRSVRLHRRDRDWRETGGRPQRFRRSASRRRTSCTGRSAWRWPRRANTSGSKSPSA